MRQTKFLTLDGPEPREGGRVPSPNLEHVSPPVKARRGLHSDAVFEIWDLERKGFKDALKTARILRRLPGLSHSGNSSCVVGVLHYIPVLRLSVKRAEWLAPITLLWLCRVVVPHHVGTNW